MKYGAILQALLGEGVEFIIIGGLAGVANGAARVTYDVDVVYRRSEENLNRIVKALATHHPYLRGAPPGLPFCFDVPTLKRGLNFTLVIDLGELDLLGEVTGGGRYEDLLPHTFEVQIDDCSCHCVDLPTLILLKRASGRPKDNEALAELEMLLEERNQAS